MSEENEAVLEYDIVLSAKASTQIEQYLESIQAKKDEKKNKEKEEKTRQEELLDTLQSLNGSQLDNIKKYLSVEGAAGGVAESLFGSLTAQTGSGKLAQLGNFLSKSAVFLAPIGAALAGTVVVPEVLKALSVKGGPFNRDWRRFIAQEVDVGLNSRQQREKELGIQQLILTQSTGWKPNNGAWTYNSLYEVNSSRLARAGLEDRAAGVLSRVVP